MAELMAIYAPALTAAVALAVLMLVQVLVVDFAGIRAKHVPGTSVPEDHSNFLFRATRTVANTNETFGLFLLVFACSLLVGATAAWVNTLVPLYVVARTVYAICYYADWRTPRSIVFGFTLLSIGGLLLACVAKLL